jgi:hypothetical protein
MSLYSEMHDYEEEECVCKLCEEKYVGFVMFRSSICFDCKGKESIGIVVKFCRLCDEEFVIDGGNIKRRICISCLNS